MAQPIQFAPGNDPDWNMGEQSYTALSWRAGSYGSRFYPGCSPGQLLGPLDPTEFKCGKLSSSIDSDRGSILNALSVLEREDELCRNYTCCGHTLNDLHALLEHFEEVHVVVVDPYAPPAYFSPAPYQEGPFDPDDMELDVEQSPPSSGGSTPPDTPLSTPLTSHPTDSFYPPTSISAFDTTTVLPSRRHGHPSQPSIPLTAFPPKRTGVQGGTQEAFNAYAGYSDYSSSMPGTVPSPPAGDEGYSGGSEPGSPYRGCVPPALLFSATTTPTNTPAISRVPSPTTSPTLPTFTPTSPPTTGKAAPHRSSTTLSRPASSLLLSKPFRCPKPNCNKSYKQANGLKYHMTHGSCNFAPPKDLEQVQALLAVKRGQREAASTSSPLASSSNTPTSPPSNSTLTHPSLSSINTSLSSLSETELLDLEREAERRLRPFACGVGECTRRYKNMNGLRYHYQHSGEHGVHGMGLLASGVHECLVAGAKATANTNGGSNEGSRQGTPMQSGQCTPTTRRGTPQAHSTPSHPSSHSIPPSNAVGQGNAYAQQAQAQYQMQQMAYQQQQYMRQGMGGYDAM